MPLASEDAVDLVIPATDSLQVPHSPHSPALLRVWDETGGPISPTHEPEDDQSEDDDPRFVLTVADTEIDIRREDPDVPEVVEPEDSVREHTPPPYARMHGYGVGVPVEEEIHNPWA